MGDREIVRGVGYAFLSVAMVVLIAGTAEAEWIGGEVRLNLRIGPGTNRKIITTVSTGDRVTVLNRDEQWVQVRIADGRDGWIPAGFLVDKVPAVVRLKRSDTELAGLRKDLERVSAEAETLRASNATLERQNQVLTKQNRLLETENHRLKAGARWPEWVAGASILVVGMLVGAIVHAWTNRRSLSRVRL